MWEHQVPAATAATKAGRSREAARERERGICFQKLTEFDRSVQTAGGSRDEAALMALAALAALVAICGGTYIPWGRSCGQGGTHDPRSHISAGTHTHAHTHTDTHAHTHTQHTQHTRTHTHTKTNTGHME